MRHLTADQLVDLTEGTRAESSIPHLTECAACRERVSDLRVMRSRVADVALPEPSPLFWDRFSARVREAVEAEPLPRSHRVTWLGPVSGLACAALVMVAVLASLWFRRPAVAVPSPRAEAAMAIESADVTLVPPDDPALEVVADLGASLDWQDIHDGALVAHAGLIDRAVNGLSAGERAELGKLLKQELRGGGN